MSDRLTVGYLHLGKPESGVVRYGRLLAYVWVDETMVNAELLRRGLAQVMTVPPNVRHQPLFLKLQREARDAGRGLWREPAPTAR